MLTYASTMPGANASSAFVSAIPLAWSCASACSKRFAHRRLDWAIEIADEPAQPDRPRARRDRASVSRRPPTTQVRHRRPSGREDQRDRTMCSVESRHPSALRRSDPLRPTTPHAAAGIRMDPPVSVPIDASPMPRDHRHARSAAGSAGRPREIARIAHGTERAVLRRGAERELVKVGLADENRAGGLQARGDGRVGLRDVLRPAPWMRRSSAGRRRRSRSLSEIGMPCRAPRAWPRARSASARFAAARASSASTRMKALVRGCWRAMAASDSSTSSAEEREPARSRLRASCMVI